jgi:hypothetical protein
MANISELKWVQTKVGRCPGCGREVPLGRVNLSSDRREQCIDCFFGPPFEYWAVCPKCNEPYPGGKCSKCGYIGKALTVEEFLEDD